MEKFEFTKRIEFQTPVTCSWTSYCTMSGSSANTNGLFKRDAILKKENWRSLKLTTLRFNESGSFCLQTHHYVLMANVINDIKTHPLPWILQFNLPLHVLPCSSTPFPNHLSIFDDVVPPPTTPHRIWLNFPPCRPFSLSTWSIVEWSTPHCRSVRRNGIYRVRHTDFHS